MRKVLDHDLLEALVPNAKVHRDVDHLVENGLERLSFERVADLLEPPQPIVGEMSYRRNQQRSFVRKVSRLPELHRRLARTYRPMA